MNLAPGCIVEFSAKGSQPETGVVINFAGGTVRLYLLNGKETSVQEKKILHTTSRAVTSVADREQCRQNLLNTNSLRKTVSEKIDLSELHSLLVEDPRPYALSELAGFLFAPDDDDSAAALLRKLCDDHLYFKNRNDTYLPVSGEELQRALEQQAKKEQTEHEEALLVNALKKLGDSTTNLPDELKEHINDLKNFVACGEDAKISRRLTAALNKSDLNNQRKLFQALVSAKIMDPDENLAIIKYRLPVDFSHELINEAKSLCKTDITSLNRKNLLDMRIWAIDTPGSKDRDDAFSFEEHSDGSFTLWIHIADPAELILPDSPLDKEASRRGSSVYMPDQRVHMLPAEISESFLSLAEGSERLSLSFMLEFSAECEIKSLKIFEAIIKIERAIDYDTADTMLESEPWLKKALEFAEKLKKKRETNGAVMFPRQPELSIKLIDGKITVEHRNRDDRTQGMIAEFMIWANHAAAEWCHKHEIPCLYRVQDGDSNVPKFGDTFEPAAFFAILKTFRKTVVSNNPGRHHSLGLNSYTQVTSPLRRYSDLLLHRQIKSAINGRAIEYDQNSLSQIMLIADSAVSRADEIMRDRDRYFLHKYIKQLQKAKEVVYDGVVVEVGMTEVTFYVDFLCSFRHCRKPSFDVAVGQKVAVKVTQIDLLDGIIKFELRQP
ncbi:MAG: RNB domain-containing ribonuclease [Erysipelotrichia bacterium]|nr:RNB domain-containing ribonuclease [Erysipelotrichia bacterium]